MIDLNLDEFENDQERGSTCGPVSNENLDQGDTFVYRNKVFMRMGEKSINLANGDVYTDAHFYDRSKNPQKVVPVYVRMHVK